MKPSAVVVGAACLALSWPARAQPTKQQCVESNSRQQDLRRENKLRAAREELRFCASESCPELVRVDCAAALREVEGLLPTLILTATDASGHALTAVTVTMDGDKLADRLDGQPLAVDVGEHELVFNADGLVATRRVVLRASEKDRRESVVLVKIAQPVTVVQPAEIVQPATRVGASPAARPSDSQGSGQRVGGLVLAAVGLVGAGVGTGLAIWGNTMNHDRPRLCIDGGLTGPACAQAASDNASTITTSWIAGGVALGLGAAAVISGAVLLFTAPHATARRARIRVAPEVGVGFGGVAVHGDF